MEALTITAGDTVKYCYVVTNPGTADLLDVVLTDDNGTPSTTGDDFNVPPLILVKSTRTLAMKPRCYSSVTSL